MKCNHLTVTNLTLLYLDLPGLSLGLGYPVGHNLQFMQHLLPGYNFSRAFGQMIIQSAYLTLSKLKQYTREKRERKIFSTWQPPCPPPPPSGGTPGPAAGFII